MKEGDDDLVTHCRSIHLILLIISGILLAASTIVGTSTTRQALHDAQRIARLARFLHAEDSPFVQKPSIVIKNGRHLPKLAMERAHMELFGNREELDPLTLLAYSENLMTMGGPSDLENSGSRRFVYRRLHWLHEFVRFWNGQIEQPLWRYSAIDGVALLEGRRYSYDINVNANRDQPVESTAYFKVVHATELFEDDDDQLSGTLESCHRTNTVTSYCVFSLGVQAYTEAFLHVPVEPRRAESLAERLSTLAETHLNKDVDFWQTVRVAPFGETFPELHEVSRDLHSLRFAELIRHLERLVQDSSAPISAFGVTVPSDLLTSVGLGGLLATQLYLLVHVLELKRRVAFGNLMPNIPWMPLYSDWLSRIVSVGMYVLMPGLAAFVLAMHGSELVFTGSISRFACVGAVVAVSLFISGVTCITIQKLVNDACSVQSRAGDKDSGPLSTRKRKRRRATRLRM